MDLKRFLDHKGKKKKTSPLQRCGTEIHMYEFRELSNLTVVGLAEQNISSAGPLNEISEAKLGIF